MVYRGLQEVMHPEDKESIELRKEFPNAFREVHLNYHEVLAILRVMESGNYKDDDFLKAYRRMAKVKTDTYARIRREEGIE